MTRGNYLRVKLFSQARARCRRWGDTLELLARARHAAEYRGILHRVRFVCRGTI